MSNKLKKQERQMTLWESDGCIVPLKPVEKPHAGDSTGGSKPSNVGAGKAARPTRERRRTPSSLSGGQAVTNRLERITKRAEADAMAMFNHVCHKQLVELPGRRISNPRMLRLIGRLLEAGVVIENRRHETDEVLNRAWTEYCDTIKENRWITVNTNPILNTKGTRLLARRSP